MKDRLARRTLVLAMLTPLTYFGIQLAAAPFYPNYSFATMDASSLGSNRSTFATLFNVGVIVVGVSIFLSAFGFRWSLQRLGARRLSAWFVFLAITQNGLATIWAGYFSLPDSRHNTGLLGVIGLLVLPALLLVALRDQRHARAFKSYLIATCVVILVLIPVMSNATGLDTRPYAGLLQRLAALVLFLPLAIAARFLANRAAALADAPNS